MGTIYKSGINYSGGSLPSGGTTGQVLTKASNADGDVVWASGGGSMAEIFDTGLEDNYDTHGCFNLALFIERTLNLAGAAAPIGTSTIRYKAPTASIESYTWSEPDAEGVKSTSAEVTITFPDGSSVSKTVAFTSKENRTITAAQPVNAAYIDTGLTMNYAYTFRAHGFTEAGKQSVLIGAYSTSSARTTGRILGASNKFQHMWPPTSEYEYATTGIDVTKPFSYQQSATEMHLWNAGGADYSVTPTGKTQTGTLDIPILLFNETPTGNFSYGRLANAVIYDENNVELRNFIPIVLAGEEVVMLDIAGSADITQDILENGWCSEWADRIYRPEQGSLAEVTEWDE